MTSVAEQAAPCSAARALSLYAWQQAALDAWTANGCRGVVEAVTGSGKTRVGLSAIATHLERGGKSVVVVPTRELLYQWRGELTRILPDARHGLLGDGHHDELGRCDVLVSTINSARTSEFALRGSSGLLVVDECHRSGSEVNRIALAGQFEHRLGLSATHTRLDGAHETVIEPYFGGVVYRFGYADAIAQRVVAPFRVALVAVDFGAGERRQYDHLNEKVRRARRRLIESFAVPGEPFGEFMKAVNRLRMHGNKLEGIAAGQYLTAFNQRRNLLAETGAKYEGLARLESAIRGSRRTIVFTQTVRAAELAAAELVDLGIDADVLHGALESSERREVLARFSRGALHTIVAPQVLDEGLDVPDADLGVIVAASRQRRQMIQRMGRVLRPKDDQRIARFAILYVAGTSEDPAYGAHETFLDEILELADSVRNFSAESSAAMISDYLAVST